jgi:hypothetical protein
MPDRYDSEEVSKSNLRIQTIAMKACRGTQSKDKITADILTVILKCCSKLSSLPLKDFYRLVGDNCSRFEHVNLLGATKDVLCFLEASLIAGTQSNTEGILNELPAEMSQIIKTLSDESLDDWGFDCCW